MSLMIRFHILKGGSLSWINPRNRLGCTISPSWRRSTHFIRKGVQLDDVIEKIERINLEGNETPSQLVEQLGPPQKGPPKWLIKTLESVHSHEVGKKEPDVLQDKMKVM
jgi:hypothetical protein